MNGHRTPRRTSTRHQMLPAGQRPPSSPRPSLGSLGQRLWSLGGRHPAIVLSLALLLTCLLAVAGCSSDDNEQDTTTTAAISTTTSTAPDLAQGSFPVTVTDDNGSSVTITERPERVVSTAPAYTEMLFALDLGDRVVGVSSLDDYPPEVADIAKVGDFQVNTEAVMALSPDLVVGYSGNEEGLAPVQQAGAAVLIFNPTNLEGIYANITTVGAATGATGKAAQLIESIKAQIKTISDTAKATGTSPTVFYALDNTLWTAGPGSFVDELLALVGATNVASMPGADGAAAQAYYQFSPEQLLAADPEVILLPGSVYTSEEEFTSDARFAGLKAVKEGRVHVIDDVVVTRPGPRIGDGLEILATAIHPGAF